jgi:hypothetical protein
MGLRDLPPELQHAANPSNLAEKFAVSFLGHPAFARFVSVSIQMKHGDAGTHGHAYGFLFSAPIE